MAGKHDGVLVDGVIGGRGGDAGKGRGGVESWRGGWVMMGEDEEMEMESLGALLLGWEMRN